MKSLSKDNDPNFHKMVIRDVCVLLGISMMCAIGIVLTLYFSVKYGW